MFLNLEVKMNNSRSESLIVNIQNKIISRAVTFKLIGVGSAGSKVVDLYDKLFRPGFDAFAADTDLQILKSLSSADRIHVGMSVTRGLDTGCDIKLGREIAEKENSKFSEICGQADFVICVSALGGGTGGGMTPFLVECAHKAGAKVVVFAITPFGFEGERRLRNARLAYEQLKESADLLVLISNEVMVEDLGVGNGMPYVFDEINHIIVNGIAGIMSIAQSEGIIRVGFGELLQLLQSKHSDGCLMFASASGENRIEKVLNRIVASQLFARNSLSELIDSVLISLTATDTISSRELENLINNLKIRVPQAEFLLNVKIGHDLKTELAASIITVYNKLKSRSKVFGRSELLSNIFFPEPCSKVFGQGSADDQGAAIPEALIPPPPELSADEIKSLVNKKGKVFVAAKKMIQPELGIQIIPKGRFQNTEPTIYNGEDLDVPTFMRKGIPLN
jgi:cell division protein FtsZ